MKTLSPKEKLKSILDKTVKNGSCMEWTGNYFLRKKGKQYLPSYPYIYHSGKVWRGNRLVLFLHSGKLEKDLFSLHKCDNTKCVNPEHLYWGDSFDNVRDSYVRGRARNLKVTHCPHGHKYSGQNLRIDKWGGRHCRSCAAYRNRKMKIGKAIYDEAALAKINSLDGVGE